MLSLRGRSDFDDRILIYRLAYRKLSAFLARNISLTADWADHYVPTRTIYESSGLRDGT
jgi:hypothetical protein